MNYPPYSSLFLSIHISFCTSGLHKFIKQSTCLLKEDFQLPRCCFSCVLTPCTFTNKPPRLSQSFIPSIFFFFLEDPKQSLWKPPTCTQCFYFRENSACHSHTQPDESQSTYTHPCKHKAVIWKSLEDTVGYNESQRKNI